MRGRSRRRRSRRAKLLTLTDVGYIEDLRDTTRKLLHLRFEGPPVAAEHWKSTMPEVLGRFVVRLVNGLDRACIYGDVLGFLPTRKSIEEACDFIRGAWASGRTSTRCSLACRPMTSETL